MARLQSVAHFVGAGTRGTTTGKQCWRSPHPFGEGLSETEMPSAFASRCRSTMVPQQLSGVLWMKELRTVAEVLERLSHNQDALRASVEELAKWLASGGRMR